MSEEATSHPHQLSIWRSYAIAFALRPLAVTIPTMMVPIGIATLVLGQGASRAFSLIAGGAVVAHLMGVLLALGGVLTLAGMVRWGTFTELIGLVFVAAGSLIYSSGAIIGLGTNGIISAGAYVAIGIGCVGRVITLSSLAHQLPYHERHLP